MYVYVLGYTLYWVHVPMLASLYNSLCFLCVGCVCMYMYFALVHKCFHLFRDDNTTCAVCAWTMLANSDMSPVYTLPLGTVCTSDVLPAGEAPSQGLEEAWQVSKGHPTQSRGWVVSWSDSEQ